MSSFFHTLTSLITGAVLTVTGATAPVTKTTPQTAAVVQTQPTSQTSTTKVATTTIINNYTTQPVIERTVTTINTQSITDLNKRISDLSSSFSNKLSTLSTNQGAAVSQSLAPVYQQIALTNKIDVLTGTTLTAPIISGGTASDTSFSNATFSDLLTGTSARLSGNVAIGTSSALSLLEIGPGSTTTASFILDASTAYLSPVMKGAFEHVGDKLLFTDATGYRQQLNPRISTSMASTSVANWTHRAINAGGGNNWSSVIWSPDLHLFVLFGNGTCGSSCIMTSPDGINWTARSVPVNNPWKIGAWSPELGMFAAISTTGTANQVMTSPDGINWTVRTTPEDNSWADIVWSPQRGLFVAVASSGTNRVMTSPDGINWTLRTASANIGWGGVTWAPEPSLFVALAGSGSVNCVMTSPDGINWTSRVCPANTSWRAHPAWSPELGLFVVVNRDNTGAGAMTSPDGINWTIRTTPTNSWMSVEWARELNLFVAVSSDVVNSGSIMTSPDGINWTSRVSPGGGNGRIVWAPQLGVFVASIQSSNNVLMSQPFDTTQQYLNIYGRGGVQSIQGTTTFSGNVGLGTTSPTDLLHLASTLPRLYITDTDSATDNKHWFLENNAGAISFGTTTDALAVTNTRALTISNTGNLMIGTSTALGPITLKSGAYVTTGGTWTNASDRNLKENFTDLDPTDILTKITQLPITQWNYKSESASTTHIGPMAQDFFGLFGLGGSNTSISTIDPAGVALVGVKALATRIDGLVAWFASAGNGILDFFADRVNTRELCVYDDAGAKTCVNKGQLDSILGNSISSNSSSGGSGGGDFDTSDENAPSTDEASTTPSE